MPETLPMQRQRPWPLPLLLYFRGFTKFVLHLSPDRQALCLKAYTFHRLPERSL